jgi:hypothetical protein
MLHVDEQADPNNNGHCTRSRCGSANHISLLNFTRRCSETTMTEARIVVRTRDPRVCTVPACTC